MLAGMPRPGELGHLRERWARERAFHDELSAEFDPAAMPAVAPAIYDAAVLEAAGIEPGMRVLDLGCGQGDLTLTLLELGAVVTGIDVSAGMIDVARRRVTLHGRGRHAEFVVAPVEASGLPERAFDLVVGRWILHHLDLAAAAPELARILVPGGRLIILENSGGNRVLNFARNHVAGRFGIPRLGTVDERPLTSDDLGILARSFASVRAEYPIVEVAELFNRQVLRYRYRRLSAASKRLDNLFGRVEHLRRYSYRVLVIAEAARADDPRP